MADRDSLLGVLTKIAEEFPAKQAKVRSITRVHPEGIEQGA